MKKIFLVLICCFSILNLRAQTTFEKGFFINNSGEKIECYINNLDLLYSPKELNYKLSLTSKPISASIEDVKVYEIYDFVKYERHTVDIDRSSQDINELSTERNPEYNSEQVFLKVLIEGEATLYQYAESNFLKFFYSKKDSQVEQLVFKNFLMDNGTTINKNEYYKQQLLNDLKCDKITKNTVSNLIYRTSSLINFFEKYNKCTNTSYINYAKKNDKKSKSSFNLSLRAGLNMSSLSVTDARTSIRNLEYGTKINPAFGFELEYVFGFNNNKWSLILQPTFQSYSSTTEDTVGRMNEANYKSIEIPFGVRHHLFLNKKNKFYLNALIIGDLSFDSEIDTVIEKDLEPLSIINYAFGVGYTHNNKLSIELRLLRDRELLSIFSGHDARYNSLSLMFGYNLF